MSKPILIGMFVVYYIVIIAFIGMYGSYIGNDAGIQTAKANLAEGSWIGSIIAYVTPNFLGDIVMGISSLPLLVNAIFLVVPFIILTFIVVTSFIPTLDGGG